MGLCVWAGTALLATLPITDFTLAWTHSIEKIRWEEDWRATPGGLEIVEARIRGTGAGMEPPEGAELRNGVWHYRPGMSPRTELEMTRSRFADDYQLCFDGRCRPLAALARNLQPEQSVKFVSCNLNDPGPHRLPSWSPMR